MRILLLLSLPSCSQTGTGTGNGLVTPGADPAVETPGASEPADTDLPTGAEPVEAVGCETPAVLGPATLMSAWGPLEGRADGDTVTFQGVPYAAAPTGDLRFRPPEPPACWTEPVDATHYGPICPQVLPLGAVALQSEDCLSLNVWTPALDGAARPVMVFVHGGANAVGSAQDLFGGYEGRALAEAEDVVVVTLQYRLGALGFLAHPALRDEGTTSGNQAILDQQMALAWVRDHAAALGGDPDRVMLFGESAGALDTCIHLAAPASAGLFSSALVESGACVVGTLAEAERDGLSTSGQIGCTTLDPAASLACLREAPAEVLSLLAGDLGFDDTWGHLLWGPIVDGTVLPEDPIVAFRAGRHAGVPVMVGSNANEGELFTPPLLGCLDTGLFVDATFGSLAPVIRDVYPCLGSSFVPRWSAVDAVTDASFSCHARRALDALHEGGAPVWRYVYDYTRADPLVFALRAFHSAELPLVFGTHDRLGYLPPRGEDELSAELMATWAALARDGDPGTTPWDPGTDIATRFDADLFSARIDTVERFRAEQCDVLDGWLFAEE